MTYEQGADNGAPDAACAAEPFDFNDKRFAALRERLLDAVRRGEPLAAFNYARALVAAADDEGITCTVGEVLAAAGAALKEHFRQQRPATGRKKQAKARSDDDADADADAEPHPFKGAGFDAEIARLAKLSAAEYERQRKAAAEAMGIRASALDKLVARARGKAKPGQGSPLVLDDVEPAAQPRPLAELLDEVRDLFSRHVILPPHAAEAAALWAAATWAVEHTDCAPIFLVRSPMPRCGKTTMLEILDLTARRPLPAASITPAALFRTIEAASPTLLIDEGDAFLKGDEELRGVINAGHTRATAFVIRTVGDDYEPRRFNVFGFKAIALIGKAAETIADRSVVVHLRRKLPSEKAAKLRDASKGRIKALKAGLARWALDEAKHIADARPQVPEGLNDRAADSWRPLLAVAELAGGEWPERARAAAVALSSEAEQGASAGTELLADVRRVFEEKGVDRISGADLLTALLDDAERPWATMNKGKPLSQAQLARRLSVFGITSRSIRLPDGRTPKGYPREAFDDAFARYLPSTPFESATPPQASNGAGCGGFQNRHTESVWHFEKPPQASNGAGCGGVALSNPPEGESRDVDGDFGNPAEATEV